MDEDNNILEVLNTSNILLIFMCDINILYMSHEGCFTLLLLSPYLKIEDIRRTNENIYTNVG